MSYIPAGTQTASGINVQNLNERAKVYQVYTGIKYTVVFSSPSINLINDESLSGAILAQILKCV